MALQGIHPFLTRGTKQNIGETVRSNGETETTIEQRCLTPHPAVRIEKGDFRRKDLRDIDFENNRGVPVVPQAIASEYDELRRIVDCMASLGYTRVDINLGCPFPILAYRYNLAMEQNTQVMTYGENNTN